MAFSKNECEIIALSPDIDSPNNKFVRQEYKSILKGYLTANTVFSMGEHVLYHDKQKDICFLAMFIKHEHSGLVDTIYIPEILREVRNEITEVGSPLFNINTFVLSCGCKLELGDFKNRFFHYYFTSTRYEVIKRGY